MDQKVEATNLNSTTWPQQHHYQNLSMEEQEQIMDQDEYINPAPSSGMSTRQYTRREMRQSLILVSEMKNQATDEKEKFNLAKLKKMVDDCLKDEDDCIKQLERTRTTLIRCLTDIESTLQKFRRNADSTEKQSTQKQSMRLPKCLRH